MVWPKVVKITGKVTGTGACETTDPNKYFDFEIIAPYMENADVPDNLSVSARFSACYMDCDDNVDCHKIIEGGLPLCPSPEASPPAYFGGTPGYISLEEAEENRLRILAEQEAAEGQE